MLVLSLYLENNCLLENGCKIRIIGKISSKNSVILTFCSGCGRTFQDFEFFKKIISKRSFLFFFWFFFCFFLCTRRQSGIVFLSIYISEIYTNLQHCHIKRYTVRLSVMLGHFEITLNNFENTLKL